MFDKHFAREAMESKLNVLAELRSALYASREALLFCHHTLCVEDIDPDVRTEVSECIDSLRSLERQAIILTNKVVADGMSSD